MIRSLNSIQPGAELRVAYVDTVLPTVERNMILAETYGFECSCERCYLARRSDTNNVIRFDRSLRADRWGRPVPPLAALSMAEGLDKLSPVLPALHCSAAEGSEAAVSSLSIPQVLEQIKKICGVWGLPSTHKNILQYQKYGVKVLERLLHPFNLDLYTKRCELFSLALDVGNVDLAAELGDKITIFLQTAYRDVPFHPLLGLHYCAMSDLHKERGDVTRCFDYRDKARTCLLVVFGEKSVLISMLNDAAATTG